MPRWGPSEDDVLASVQFSSAQFSSVQFSSVQFRSVSFHLQSSANTCFTFYSVFFQYISCVFYSFNFFFCLLVSSFSVVLIYFPQLYVQFFYIVSKESFKYYHVSESHFLRAVHFLIFLYGGVLSILHMTLPSHPSSLQSFLHTNNPWLGEINSSYTSLSC